MSVENMLSALNLEMSAKVPRTEYSAHTHWPLIERVTGLRVDADSTPEEREEASRQFVRAWDYSMMWNVCIYNEIFGDQRTSMGHAVYAEGGTDYNDQIFQLFEDPEDVYDYDLFEAHGTPDVDAIARRCDENFDLQNRLYPDCLNMAGIYVTCISGVLELLG